MSEAVLEELKESAGIVRTDLTVRYVLFSISGFTEGLSDTAADEGVTLVELKDLMTM